MKAVLKLNEELKIFAKILVDFRHLFFFTKRPMSQCDLSAGGAHSAVRPVSN